MVIGHWLFSLAGCGPTYRARDFEESIKKLCREQYKKDVRVEIVGRTARIYAAFDNLFDLKTLGISRDAADKIDDILLAVHRVTLSTDKLLDFYVFVAQSNEIKGAQVLLVRYIDDSKRLLLGDISRGEYFNRMMLEAKINEQVIGEEKVKALFYDLARYKGMNDILKDHFAKDITADGLSIEFLTLASERWLKSDIRYELSDIRSKKEPQGPVLVYFKAKELYSPKNLFGAGAPVYPAGLECEYIMALSVSGLIAYIDRVLPLTRFVGGRFVRINPPPAYQDYLSWRDEDKFAGDVRLADFLAEQLARRIKSKLEQDNLIAPSYEVKAVEGDYAGGSFVFNLDLTGKAGSGQEEGLDERAPEDTYIFRSTIKLISEVLRRYEFRDFKNIVLINKRTEGTFILTKEEALSYR